MAADSNVGQRIREALRKRGMTSAELARELGVTDGAVAHWLTGANKPRPERIIEIAMILDVNPHWVAYGVEEPEAAGDRRIRDQDEAALLDSFRRLDRKAKAA